MSLPRGQTKSSQQESKIRAIKSIGESGGEGEDGRSEVFEVGRGVGPRYCRWVEVRVSENNENREDKETRG